MLNFIFSCATNKTTYLNISLPSVRCPEVIKHLPRYFSKWSMSHLTESSGKITSRRVDVPTFRYLHWEHPQKWGILRHSEVNSWQQHTGAAAGMGLVWCSQRTLEPSPFETRFIPEEAVRCIDPDRGGLRSWSTSVYKNALRFKFIRLNIS